MTESFPRGLPRLELRIQRLGLTFRFTFAFHAREVRFEREGGGSEGFERVFPETFSFHAARHDPAELSVQLEDLLSKPRLLGPDAKRRDAQNLVVRLLTQAPRYLESLLVDLETQGRLDPETRLRVHQDVALLAQTLLRFMETHELGDSRSLRVGGFLLRRRIFQSLRSLVEGRVSPGYLDAYVAGRVDPVDPADDPTESGFFHTLEGGERAEVDRLLLRLAERSFYLWLEGVCLDESNEAFEKDDSPFESREREVLCALSRDGEGRVDIGEDLSPFLRRPGRGCERLLSSLERWFLRRYDINHSAAMIHHAAALEHGKDDAEKRLSYHRPSVHAAVLGTLVSPFLGAIFLYDRAPFFFDLVCSIEVLSINAAALWFLAYRFAWKRDLTFFHAGVPRIGAGIIVGYLPVFLIDEVWDLAERSAFELVTVALLLGTTTLLYIYVEVQRRLGNTDVAFVRARGLFLLGTLQAFAFGLLMTGLVGSFMVTRNWSPDAGLLPVEALRGGIAPMLGELPRIVGLEPFYAFPPALLLMTFLSFFIGIFLQLMWEELPITEPL